MAASNFPTPAPMDMKGDLAHNWSFFQSQFENYEIAVGLDKKDEAIRVATLLSVMGKECFPVFKHIEMADGDRKKIDPILQALQAHFEPTRNVISSATSSTLVNRANVKHSHSTSQNFGSWHQHASLVLSRTT